MATNTINIPELLKRARLYNPTGTPDGVLSQPQVPNQDEIPTSSPLGTGSPDDLRFGTQNTLEAGQSTPQPISEREKALSAYRQAMQEQMPSAPKQADYQPSVTRRIIGALLGGTVGAFSDPKAGGQIASNIVSAPYNKALGGYNQNLTDYQRRLAQKKEAYETEDKAAESEAKLGEQTEQKKAEVARAGAEEARRKREEWQVSPLGQEAKLAQIKAAHSGSKLYNVTLKNGESATVTRDASGQLMLGNTPLGDNAYDASTLREIGTTLPKDPKEEAAKNANVYNDFVTGTKAKNPNITPDEIARSWTQFKAQTNAQYEKPPQTLMIGPSGVAQAVRPGTAVPEGSTSVSGLSSENIGTTQTRQMAEAAPKVLDFISKIEPLIDQQVKSLGPASSRWSEFMAGKIGAPNPEFTKLRTNMILLQSTLMRMHTQRGSEYMLKHFSELINYAKQSPENMKAALGEIKSYAQSLIKKKGSSEGDSESSETTKPLTPEELRKKYGY